MAEEIRRIVQTHELTTDYLKQLIQKKEQNLHIHYDKLSDTLMLLLIPPDVETVVHHINTYVALLFKPDTLDIVGIQIEDFEHSFLPKHEAASRVWKLSDSEDALPEDFGDLVIVIERMKPKVVHEVMQAARPIFEQLGETGQSLSEALELVSA